MLKNSILFILSIISCFSSIAQITFPTGAALWTERRGQGEAPHVWHVMEQRNEVLSVLGNNYKKLYSAQFPSTPVYIGGLREDATHSIYFYDIASGTERKLYDFSLMVGDTIKAWGLSDMALGVVHSVDTVTIGSIARKRISFRQLTDTTRWTAGAWVEGIGNTGLGGLLANPMMQPTCDCGIHTLCFSQGDTDVYHNPAYATYLCLPSLAAVGNVSTDTTTVTLYPNPLPTYQTLTKISGAARATINIYDLVGKQMCSKIISKDEPFLLFTTPVVSGIYLYVVDSENGYRYTGRLIVE